MFPTADTGLWLSFFQTKNNNNPRPNPISRLSATELREKVLREKLKAMRRANAAPEKPEGEKPEARTTNG